jgi:hypothetical protein
LAFRGLPSIVDFQDPPLLARGIAFIEPQPLRLVCVGGGIEFATERASLRFRCVYPNSEPLDVCLTGLKKIFQALRAIVRGGKLLASRRQTFVQRGGA